ncbi:hypothetical protein [Kribbella speibonae]|uniref:ParB/Sulfiredoxin domain-containing protein n=1 Tax=Kribbella speibonae TaxID=1572660 RepID=A0ABY1ZY22_9ACTN|nr:hypothetical protein [Kribbella speibonae]TCC20092.1 hypothetical protein E0H58_28585 [Kribbella speibonae]
MQPLDQRLSVSDLDLDPENPRLPEELHGSEQHAILRYLYENDVLEELIDSYLSNGYFESEPVIVLPPDAGQRRVVLEGNRRLAALMIVLQLPAAVEAGILLDVETSPTAEQLGELSTIPAVQADDHADVAAYLGFRHISGLKRWDPEAKARWLWRQVEDRARSSAPGSDPFYEVGRQVGSNARGVRSSYVAYGILRHARDYLKLPLPLVDYVMRERFGVWTRLLGTANATTYIGMGDRISPTHAGVQEQIGQLDRDRLELMLRDLTPPSKNEKAILGDSREVTDYSDVLANETAVAAMREYNSLSLAVQVVSQEKLAERLREMTRSVELLTLDVKRYDVGDAEVSAAEEFALSARTLRGAILAANLGDDE